MLISRKSLLGRIYGKWEELTGGNGWGYKENLCHFVRVCVFWTPWYWFWRQELLKTFVRPWEVVAAAFVVASVIVNPPLVCSVALGILAFVALVCVLVLALYGVGKGFEKLAGIGDAIDRGLKRAWKALHVEEAWDWFWTREYRAGIKPWHLALLAIQFGSLYWITWIFWAILVVEVGYFGVLFAFEAYLYLRSRNAFQVLATAGQMVGSATLAVKQPVLGTTGVVIAWLLAQKRKICPYVEVV
jgi:hypothetical protein